MGIGKIEFEKVVFFQEGPGVRNWQFRESGIKLINIKNIVDDKLCLSNTSNYLEQEEVERKYSHFLLNQGDFVMASSGVTWGKIAEVSAKHLPLCLNTSIIRLVSRDEKVLNKWYLYYFIKSPQFRNQIDRLITGSAQPNFGPSHLKKVFIKIPDITEQHEVVKQIVRIESIIKKRKRELEELDNLIKSRFVEMFGTIYNNKFNFNIGTLQEVCEPIKDGTHQTPTYTDDAVNGYKFLSSKDVTTGKIDWNHLKYIPENLHKELYARIAPKKGDILLAKNGTTGIAAIVDRDEIFDIYVSLALLRPVEMNSVYLWGAINSVETKDQFAASLKGIGVPNLHLGEIKKTRIFVPPMELQNEFAEFVNQVDKLKFEVQKSLKETQILMDSLMQRYFG